MKTDGEALRRYRTRYIHRARRWVEADKSRIDHLARRLLEIGAYAGDPDASGARKAVRFSIVRKWAKFDGSLDGKFGWYRWYQQNGWEPYHWLPAKPQAEARPA